MSASLLKLVGGLLVILFSLLDLKCSLYEVIENTNW